MDKTICVFFWASRPRRSSAAQQCRRTRAAPRGRAEPRRLLPRRPAPKGPLPKRAAPPRPIRGRRLPTTARRLTRRASGGLRRQGAGTPTPLRSRPIALRAPSLMRDRRRFRLRTSRRNRGIRLPRPRRRVRPSRRVLLRMSRSARTETGRRALFQACPENPLRPRPARLRTGRANRLGARRKSRMQYVRSRCPRVGGRKRPQAGLRRNRLRSDRANRSSGCRSNRVRSSRRILLRSAERGSMPITGRSRP